MYSAMATDRIYQDMPLPTQFNLEWLESVSESVFTCISTLYRRAADVGSLTHNPLFYAGNDNVSIEPGAWMELPTGLDIHFPIPEATNRGRDAFIGHITTDRGQSLRGMSVLGGLHYVMRQDSVGVKIPVCNLSPFKPLVVKPGDVIGQLAVVNYHRSRLRFQPHDAVNNT